MLFGKEKKAVQHSNVKAIHFSEGRKCSSEDKEHTLLKLEMFYHPSWHEHGHFEMESDGQKNRKTLKTCLQCIALD